MDEQVVVLLASTGENSEDGFRRSAIGYKGVLNLRILMLCRAVLQFGAILTVSIER